MVNTHSPATQLSATGGYGDIVTFGSGSLTAGKVYYFGSTGTWFETDADGASTATGMLGVALSTTAAGGLLVRGYAKSIQYYTGATGAILYLSGTGGEITTTAPAGASDIVRIIGYQIDGANDIIYFNPSNDWVEI
jgi:hypothetical protein